MTGEQMAQALARLVLANLSVSEPSEREVQMLADAMISEGIRVAAAEHGVELVA